MHVFNFMNYYSLAYAPIILALLELIMTAWIYGIHIVDKLITL